LLIQYYFCLFATGSTCLVNKDFENADKLLSLFLTCNIQLFDPFIINVFDLSFENSI